MGAVRSYLGMFYTPCCNDCGVFLCYDISKEEYNANRRFWDGWKCETCQPVTRYEWFWSTRLADRIGQRFQVLARGKMNSILICFEDGSKFITSRNAATRKVKEQNDNR
jgi:hypothetical protein